MRILIAPDKFKGSLTAAQAAESIRAGWLAARPGDHIELRPVADGGEGLLDVFERAKGGRRHPAVVAGPLGSPLEAEWLCLGEDGKKLAVIESAAACGLRHLSPETANPARTTSRGVGELIAEGLRHGCGTFVVGLGGSATNDGGTGMARALGWRFLDARGIDLPDHPLALSALHRIEPPPGWNPPRVTAASDVSNPLLGPDGATRVFGPQKGLRPGDARILEQALERLAETALRDTGISAAEIPGAGAAGGLGFGLVVFCGARIRPGFDLVAEADGLEEAVRHCDLVVTGEGSLDAQSLYGKGPVALARMAARLGKPVFALAGRVDPAVRDSGLFNGVKSLGEFAENEEDSRLRAAEHLAAAASDLALRLEAQTSDRHSAAGHRSRRSVQ